MLFVVFTSQPFDSEPSQLPKPELHVMPQDPAEQVAVPFVELQTLPHAPQWLVLVAVTVSQPFATFPSQLPKPELHEMLQLPVVHDGVPLFVLQAAPHDPQWLVLLDRLVSQPFTTLPSQFPKPELQVMPQDPATQLAVPLAVLQAAPQAPQWLVLVLMLTSQPLAALASQLPNPELQAMPQTPAVHDATPFVELQAFPHAPQLATLEFRFTSQPLAALPSQLANPALQVMPQTPAVQNGVPLVLLHAVPQPPQWLVLFWVFVSQPFETLPSQLPKPALQVMPHVPPEQEAVPFVVLHTLPQVPQFDVVARLVSQPFVTLPSQLPKPALHEI